MVLNLRLCQLKDLDLLIELSRKTFVQSFKKDNNPNDFKQYIEKAFAKETLKEELLNAHSKFWFAYVGDALVGYVKLNEFQAQSEFKEEEGMELERIYVDGKYQNKGIGSQLLELALKMAREHQKNYLWLGVWEKNRSAISFYERHGFEKIGTHPYFIGKDKQTDWLMRRQL